MTNPKLIATPFAENGDKNAIPEVNTDPSKPQLASMSEGFPLITQQKISEGGIPPERDDFNGILNLYGHHIVHLNKGLPYEFDQAFADLIGGYPLNARLMLNDGNIVVSLIPNNVNNPNTDMSGWINANDISRIFDTNGINQNQINRVSSIANLVLINPKSSGSKVYVLSYIAGNNKGGGNFLCIDKGTLTANNITIFNSANPSLLWVRINYDSISPEMAGAVGDGVTDDSDYLQNLISYKFLSKLPICCESSRYAVSKTLIIPQAFDNTFRNDIWYDYNFCNVNFMLLGDITLFTSGYTNSDGILVSNYDTPLMSYNSFYTKLGNFTVSKSSGYSSSPVLKIQDWHQGCKIYNIATHISQTFLMSKNNFYTKFESLHAQYSGGDRIGTRFGFYNEHNLCTFKDLVAVNSDIGYRFYGPTTACLFTESSLEGMNTGIVFDATVYGFNLANCYAENFDLCLKFNSYFTNFSCTNNYINYVAKPDSSYFLEYAALPGCGINIDSSNMFINYSSKSQILKNKEDVYGAGINITFDNINSGDINDIIVSGITGRNGNFNQIVNFSGFKGYVAPSDSYLVGRYSGKFSNGFDGQNGFVWNNLGTETLSLSTRIQDSKTQRIYVNITCLIGGSNVFIKGDIIGGYPARFYEFTDTGVVVSNKLNISVVGGYIQINGTLSGIPTSVTGEVRLI